MQDSSPTPEHLQHTVRGVRRRWLAAVALNAAVLPALWAGLAVTLAGFAIAVAGGAVVWLVVLILPVLGAGALAAWRAAVHEAARRHAGTPPWLLALDREAAAGDALVTGLEHEGPFPQAALRRAAAQVTPEAARACTPALRRGALVVAVLLAFGPLMFWRLATSDEFPEPPEHVARHSQNGEGQNAAGTDAGGNGEPADEPNGTENGGTPAEGEGETEPGETGQPQDQPGQESEPAPGQGEGSPEAPPDPDQPSTPPDTAEGEPQELPPEPEAPDFGTDIERVRPEAGDGETDLAERSRWVYNPDGTPERASGTRTELESGGELRIPRTKATTSERERLRAIYRTLFE
jgi:hypothetical protein